MAAAISFHSLLYKHRIAEAEKTIPLSHCFLICLHNRLFIRERGHQHQQGGFRQMEVGDQGVHDLEMVAGVDEDFGPAASCFQDTVFVRGGFQGSAAGGADADNTATGGFGIVDKLGLVFFYHLCYLKCNRDKEIHQREIEYWFQLKNPTVTGILNRLEEKGYITRRRNPEDGRYRIIEVTEKGNRVMEDMGEGARDLDERIYDCMTDEEQAKLLELLDRILATMSENDGSGAENQAWKEKHDFPDEIAANTVNTD